MSTDFEPEFLDYDAVAMERFALARGRELCVPVPQAHLAEVVETLMTLRDHARRFTTEIRRGAPTPEAARS